jgi:hypothetical protein
LAEQQDEWTEMRRYIGPRHPGQSRLAIVENTEPEEMTLTAITAQSPTQDHAEANTSHTTTADATSGRGLNRGRRRRVLCLDPSTQKVSH